MSQETLTPSAPVANVKKVNKTTKKGKKLLSSSEFSRVAALAVTIKKNGGYTDSEKVINEADKLYKEKTGTPLNYKETKCNFQFVVRFLKAYEAK